MLEMGFAVSKKQAKQLLELRDSKPFVCEFPSPHFYPGFAQEELAKEQKGKEFEEAKEVTVRVSTDLEKRATALAQHYNARIRKQRGW